MALSAKKKLRNSSKLFFCFVWNLTKYCNNVAMDGCRNNEQRLRQDAWALEGAELNDAWSHGD